MEGILTTQLGILEAGRVAFLQDSTAGIALYTSTAADPVAAGSTVRATGTLDDRYGERTIRLAGPPTVLDGGLVPPATEAATGAATESLEGLRLRVHGTVMDAPTILSDGPAVTLDDGSGPLRAVFAGSAAASVPARGSIVTVAGSLGQRDSSGTGTSGYRLFVLDPFDVIEEPAPSPSPTPTEEPSPAPTPSPSPAPSPTPTPSPSPAPSPSPVASSTPAPTAEAATIAVARGAAIGASVHIQGMVTGSVGRVGLPPLGVVADASGGIYVRFPDGVAPSRGTLLDIVGRLADPYGQLEIRPSTRDVRVIGTAPLADPVPIGAGSLGELVEGRLVTLDATLDAAIARESGGDLVLRLVDASGASLRARATRASGLEPSCARRGDRLRLVGIVGQHATTRGALDGYRIWLRDAGDIVRLPDSGPGPTPSNPPGASPGSSPGASSAPVVTIAAALRLGSGSVAVEGTVSISSTLLDATGRRSVVQDSTAAVEFLVPRDSSAPRVGDRVRIVGALGRAYGAPRITAAALVVLGHGAGPAATPLTGPPSTSLEWRLVSIEGMVSDQRRLGDRWRAEVAVGRTSVPVAGLPGAGIPASSLVEGSRVRIVGIVRRPNPAATDQHLVLVPRSPADIRVIGRVAASTGTARPSLGTGRSGTSANGATGSSDAAAGTTASVSADASALATMVGRSVRVGGLVVSTDANGLVLDDGTGTVRLELAGDARSLLPLMQAGDAIGASGIVQAGASPAIQVAGAADLVRLGDLGEPLPLSADPVPADMDADELADPLQSGGPGGSPSPAMVASGGSGGASFVPLTAGIGSIGALATAGTMFLVARRRRDRRMVRARIERRVSELGALFTGASTPDVVPGPGEPGPSSVPLAPIVRELA